MSKVGVIGLGYVGLPLMVHVASQGTSTLGFDIDSDLVDDLRNGITRISEVQRDLKDLKIRGYLDFTDDASRLAECNVLVICVPTPLTQDSTPDLQPLLHAIGFIEKFAAHETLIINESTSYPGTLRELFFERFAKSADGRRLYFAVAPERIDPNSKIRISEIPRVVSGIDSESSDKAVEFYEKFFKFVHKVSSPEIAEFSKLLENTFRQVNISLVNELNDLCRNNDLDMREVIDAAATKPYGFMPFFPSAGIGGHCIPVDPMYLQYFAKTKQTEISMITRAHEVNDSMGSKVATRLGHFLNLDECKRALLIGITYKPDVPDTRETPAERILDALLEKDIEVDWHDPLVSFWKGSKSVDVGSKLWDFGIIVTASSDIDYSRIIENCKSTFDLTGHLRKNPDVIQI